MISITVDFATYSKNMQDRIHIQKFVKEERESRQSDVAC